MNKTKKLAVLFSGSGTNLENILHRLHGKSFGDTRIEVALALTNKPNAGGIEKARKYGVESLIISHAEFPNREDYDRALVDAIESHEIDLFVFAGFIRILTPVFTTQVRAINVHPSLLPDFKGADAIHRSYNAGAVEAGASVHWVNEELDGGELIEQKSFHREADMSYEAFEQKIHEIEYEILPEAIVEILCEEG
jgi:phosphoribosylglycinamide formyltransferase-1